MKIVRWEPFRGMAAESEPFLTFPFGGFDEGLSTHAWVPPVDIYETDHDVVMKAELPGVDPKDVELRVEEGTLYLKGERRFEKEVKEDNYHRVERSFGSFARSFRLPASVDSDQAKAEYKDGLLTLTLPKREEAKPKAIPVEVSRN